jgi:diguanylate cyclase (GGDEF)-like protein/PAS domain S-box-containing protein
MAYFYFCSPGAARFLYCENALVDNLLNFELADLQSQIAELSTFITEPDKLQEHLLLACSDLLALYEHVETNRHSFNPQAQTIGLSTENTPASLHQAFQSLQVIQLKLSEVETRYRALVESDNVFICRLLPDGSLRYANPAYLRCIQPSDQLTNSSNFFSPLGFEKAAEVQQRIAKLSPEESEFTFTAPIYRTEDSVCWQQWTCRAFFDSDLRLREIHAVGHDITAIKLAEMEAEQHNRQLSALHTATRALLTTLDSETLLGQILDAAIVAVPVAKKGTLHLIARDTGQLELRASVGYSDPRIKKFTFAGASGYVAQAVRERRPLLHADHNGRRVTSQSGSFPDSSDVRSAIVAPLVLQERVLGAISLESSSPSAFTNADLNLLVSFAATATNVIHNAELHAEVQKLALTDALTGLYNRRGFYELGQREIERSFRFKHPLTAIMMDVDNFKLINDQYGHATGDQVLRSIAAISSKMLRKVDIIGRYGGDEFIILLPETHIRLGSLVAERLQRGIAALQLPNGGNLLRISISMGVSGLTTEVTDLDTLIHRADLAMYAARHNSGI